MPSTPKRSTREPHVSIRHRGRATRLSVTVPRLDADESDGAARSLAVFAEVLTARLARAASDATERRP
jgi:hypothetical protein